MSHDAPVRAPENCSHNNFLSRALLVHAQVDLTRSELCGINYKTGAGTYTSEGIKAIADAVIQSRSLTGVPFSLGLAYSFNTYIPWV